MFVLFNGALPFVTVYTPISAVVWKDLLGAYYEFIYVTYFTVHSTALNLYNGLILNCYTKIF